MAKPQKSTAQPEVPGLVKKGPLYYLKRDWQLYALMLLPMVFIMHRAQAIAAGGRCCPLICRMSASPTTPTAA